MRCRVQERLRLVRVWAARWWHKPISNYAEKFFRRETKLSQDLKKEFFFSFSFSFPVVVLRTKFSENLICRRCYRGCLSFSRLCCLLRWRQRYISSWNRVSLVAAAASREVIFRKNRRSSIQNRFLGDDDSPAATTSVGLMLFEPFAAAWFVSLSAFYQSSSLPG